MNQTTVEADGNPRGARTQRAVGENERMAELELMFFRLVGNVEYLNGESAELCRRLGALELVSAAEAASP